MDSRDEAIGVGLFTMALMQTIGSIIALALGHTWTAGALWATAIVLLMDFMSRSVEHREGFRR